jgi:hypothetical protein
MKSALILTEETISGWVDLWQTQERQRAVTFTLSLKAGYQSLHFN